MKFLKKNQLAILVIALMLVTAGYLNYTANDTALTSNSNVIDGEQYAAIGDATLVNSGELLDEKDKQNIINTINNAQENNDTKNTVETNASQENTSLNNTETTRSKY